MERRLALSIGSKLLISVVLLVFGVIAFLNVSAILLMRDDKRAYVYESQSTSAILAGRAFVSDVRNCLDTLRIALGSIQPGTPVTALQQTSLQTLIDNQSATLAVSLGLLKASGDQPALNVATTVTHQKAPEKAEIEPEWLKSAWPDLERDSYALVNLSRLGGTARLGVLLADREHKLADGTLPVALGIVSLQNFGADLTGELSVATSSGWTLFSTDPAALYSRRNITNDPLFDRARQNRASGATEFISSENVRFLGSYVQPGYGLVVMARQPWAQAMLATYRLTEKFVLLGLMSIGLAIVFAILFSKTLTAPIQRLFRATSEVAQGNFGLTLKPSSGDEIGALTQAFNSMSAKIRDLVVESVEKVKLENELSIASTVQKNLIPVSNHRAEKFSIGGFYQSASQCGGDWWGFFEARNKLVIVIADATGHGLPSALLTASVRSCFSVLEQQALKDPEFDFSPAAMMACADRVIYDASKGSVMMTCFIAVFDFDYKFLSYANAGHNPPWYGRRDADGKYQIQSLVANGRRLGDISEPANFEEKMLEIGPKDVLFLYTDGLLECVNLAGEMYGKKRARNSFNNVLRLANPEPMVNEVATQFTGFCEGVPPADDLTLAAVVLT